MKDSHRYAACAALIIGWTVGRALANVHTLATDEGWREGFRAGYAAHRASHGLMEGITWRPIEWRYAANQVVDAPESAE